MILPSGAQMREIDRRTIEDAGVPGRTLMGNAAAAVVALIGREYASAIAAAPVAVIAGPGNNGGDGLVAARLLRERGVAVQVALLGAPERLRGDAAGALAALRALDTGREPSLTGLAGVPDWERWRQAHLAPARVLIDALFGVGLTRELSGLAARMVGDINRDFHGAVVAVDLPSGLAADGSLPSAMPTRAAPALRANWTVTFTAPKRGHMLDPRAAATVGRLRVVAIGTPAEQLAGDSAGAALATPALCARYLAPRRRDAHKGSFGHVLVIGGSLGKSGAVALAAGAALRMGAGLVTAAVPRSILPLVAAARAELMTEPLEEDAAGALTGLPGPQIERLLQPASVLALGPGLGRAPAAQELVRTLMRSSTMPRVLDADGLNAFAGRRAELAAAVGAAPAVLTPHPGEMARLFACETAEVTTRPLYYAQRLAGETGAVAVLKIHRTIVAAPAGTFSINTSGNPGMATGGSGDVLTGMIAGLIAQFPQAPLESTAAAAVYLHGRAGDAAAAVRGEMALLAGDLIEFLPSALAGVAADARQPELPAEIAG